LASKRIGLFIVEKGEETKPDKDRSVLCAGDPSCKNQSLRQRWSGKNGYGKKKGAWRWLFEILGDQLLA